MSITHGGDERPPFREGASPLHSDTAAACQETASDQSSKVTQTLTENIRRASQTNGYVPVSVCTGTKEPAHKGWQKGGPDAQLYPARPHALNTGILTGDVLALDIDCDDPATASLIEAAARQHLGSAPCRHRSNSPRKLLTYRAASPGMRKTKIGQSGAGVEILATGQQFVAYGLHPSGVHYRWEGNIGPHNTPLHDLRAVTETQIDAFVVAAASILADELEPPREDAKAHSVIEILPLPRNKRPIVFDSRSDFPDLNAKAQAGMDEPIWFDDLSPADKNAFLRETATHPAMVPMADQDRSVWLRLLFALADAGRRGATEAKEIARTWSKTSARYNETAFERDWKSFR